jgi:hypothetical protein
LTAVSTYGPLGSEEDDEPDSGWDFSGLGNSSAMRDFMTEPKLGDWRGAPSRSSCWVTKRSSTTAAPQASSNNAYPSPKVKSYCKKYTRGLAVTTQHLEPSWETPSDRVSTGRLWWPTPLGLYAPAKGVNSTQSRPTCPLRLCKQYPSPGRLLCGVWTLSVPCRRHPGLHAPAGRHRQILQVD